MSMPRDPAEQCPQGAILVCVNRRLGPHSVSCAARGSEAIAQALERALAARGTGLCVRRIHCFGRCAEGPNLRLAPGGSFRRGVRPGDVDDIAAALLAEHAARTPSDGSSTP